MKNNEWKRKIILRAMKKELDSRGVCVRKKMISECFDSVKIHNSPAHRNLRGVTLKNARAKLGPNFKKEERSKMTNENINQIEQAVTTLLSLIKDGVWGEKTVVSEQSVWDRNMLTLIHNSDRLAALQARSRIHMDHSPRQDRRGLGGDASYSGRIEPGFVNVWERAQRNPQSIRTDGHPHGVTDSEMSIHQHFPREMTPPNSGEVIFSVDFGSLYFPELPTIFNWIELTARYPQSKPYRRVNKNSWVNLDLRNPKYPLRINRRSNIPNLMGRWDNAKRSWCRLATRHFFKMVCRDIRAMGADPKYLKAEVFSLLEARWRGCLLSGMGNMGNAHRLKTTKNKYHEDIRVVVEEIKRSKRKAGSAIVDNYTGSKYRYRGPEVLLFVNLHVSESKYVSLRKIPRDAYREILTQQGIVSRIGHHCGKKRRIHCRKASIPTEKTIRGLAYPISKFRDDEITRIAKSFQLNQNGTRRLISVAASHQSTNHPTWTNYILINVQRGDLALDESGRPKVLLTIAKKKGLNYPNWYRRASTQDLLRHLENKLDLSDDPSETLPELSETSFIWCENLLAEDKICPGNYFSNDSIVRRWVNDMHYSARGDTLWRKYKVGRSIFAREICIMDVVNDLTEGDVCGDDDHDWDHEDLSRAYLSSPKAVLQRYHKRAHTLKKADYRGSEWEFEAGEKGCPDEVWVELKKIHCSEIQLLTTLGELAHESDIMDHCVWDFSKDIAEREILIFHIGDIDGSTLGFNWQTGNIVHHNGVRDRKPTKKEKEIEALVVSSLRSIRDTWSLSNERKKEK